MRGRSGQSAAAAVVLLLALACCLQKDNGAAAAAAAAPLAVASSVQQLWGELVFDAADATVQAIQQQTGLDMSLRDVPLESLQVFVASQHHLAIETEGGQTFELTLNNKPSEEEQAAAAAAGAAAGLKALPMPEHMSSTALAELRRDPWSWQRQHITLPEVTLAGPVELVFSHTTDLSLWLPHATDAPRARRLLLAPGAALTLRDLKRVSLRKPVDLPKLPGSYLAEAYASVKIGEAEPGFDTAPGVLFLAGELYRAATNASLGLGDARGRTKALLSFELEPAGASVTAVSARQPGERTAPKLRLQKLADGTLEVSLRDPEAKAAARAAAAAAAAPGGVAPSALAQQAWAWPLPLVGLEGCLPYESLLRSILVAQPSGQIQKGLQQGVALKLTKSSVKGVSLMHFDMELSSAASTVNDGAVMPADGFLDMERVEGGGDAVELWEAVVELRERHDGPGVDAVPVSVKRKHAYHSTLTLSPSAIALALGGTNRTQPAGSESVDRGFARAAAAQHPGGRDEL